MITMLPSQPTIIEGINTLGDKFNALTGDSGAS